jgi:pSer/pThr/pTyr-binding forkhead associated (FHA) protein
MPLRLTIRTTTAAPHQGPTGGEAPAELVLDRDTVSLGRAPTADVRLPGAAVSLLHARLERVGTDWFAIDGGSTNGTRLNGARLQAGQRRLLRSGDTLEVPGFVLAVSVTQGGSVSGPEATHDVARRMVREVLQALGGAGDSAPSLRIASGPQAGQRLVLADLGRAYVVGRAAACALRLDDRDVSREHATVRRDYTGVTLVDLGAKNGVMVGGRRLTGPHQLVDGDEIAVGTTAIRFDDPAEAHLRELEARPDVAAPPSSPAAPLPEAGTGFSALPPTAPSRPSPVTAPADAVDAPAAEDAAEAGADAAPVTDSPPSPRRLGLVFLLLLAVVVGVGASVALWLLLRA